MKLDLKMTFRDFYKKYNKKEGVKRIATETGAMQEKSLSRRYIGDIEDRDTGFRCGQNPTKDGASLAFSFYNQLSARGWNASGDVLCHCS